MRLTHTTSNALGTTSTSMACRPLAIVNYLNGLIDVILVKSIKSTVINGKLQVVIPTILGESIIISGNPSNVMPVISWLDSASSAYTDFLTTLEEL